MSWISSKLVSTNDYLNTIIGQGIEYSSILSDLSNRLIGKGLYYRNVHHKDMALIKNPIKRRYNEDNNKTFNKVGERINIRSDDGRQIVFLDDIGGLYGFTHGGYKQLEGENNKVFIKLNEVIGNLPSNDVMNKNIIDSNEIDIETLVNYRKIKDKGIYDYKNTDSFNALKYGYSINSLNQYHTIFNEDGLFKSTSANTINNISIGTIEFNEIDSKTYENSLLYKMSEKYKKGEIKTIVNRFYSNIEKKSSLTQSAVDSHYGLSRGRNLLKSGKPENINGYENPYCRVWTSHHQYSKFKDVIRPFNNGNSAISIAELQSKYGALRPNDGANRLNENTVLNKIGTVRVAPTKKDDITKCMFSIENLAWKDFNGLKSEQIGPNKGRIMWFPPYGLKFTENVQPQWDGHAFIGRGEKIYTYVNTERSGTLNFTILVDHPSVINKWRRGLGGGEVNDKYEREQEILRFFAGCGNLELKDEATIVNEKYKLDSYKEKILTVKEEKEPIIYNVVAFFPNHYSGFDVLVHEDAYPVSVFGALYNRYEVDKEGVIGEGGKYWPVDNDLTTVENKYEIDTYSYTLNGSGALKYEKYIKDKLGLGVNNKLYSLSDMFDNDGDLTLSKINELLKDHDLKVFTQGCASSHGTNTMNEELSNRRALLMAQWIKNDLGVDVELKPTRIIDVGKGDYAENRSSLQAKIGRCAILTLEFTPKTNAKPNNNIETIGQIFDTVNNIPDELKNSAIFTKTNVIETVSNDIDYYQEYEYFKELSVNDNLLYTNLVDKVKYFNPAFHSITPEGFNARLTFLHQCTRQGPTTSASDSKDGLSENTKKNYGAGNLAFGRAPYCVLRIGDFYNTKIMIDALTINYDTNQWDLNPEGVGVQPMLAEISINFKFVGGSDLSGPIEKLQNAVSSNYYANTSVYDSNAEIRYEEVKSENIDNITIIPNKIDEIRNNYVGIPKIETLKTVHPTIEKYNKNIIK